MIENPFYFGRMVSDDAFTDREKETERLVANFRNGINTILISPRRWGKSSLVKKVGETAKAQGSNVRIVHIDVFSLRTEQEFFTAYAKAVLEATSSHWEERLKSLKEFLKQITPKITIGVDPEHEFSIGFDWNELQQHATEILDLPEKIGKSKGLRVVVCIDEFQNITAFDNALAFQKLLRSVWQKHETACYCLYGSKFHMMRELFERQSMPFYRFGDLVYLGKISETDWRIFIREKFETTGKSIDETLISRIISDTDRHSYYVQQMSHLVWERTNGKVTDAIYTAALEDMLTQNALLYQRDTENLSATQLNFLKAVASGERTNFTSAETLKKYRLGTSANVVKIKKNLLNAEIIDIQGKEVSFIDPIYEFWFKKEISKRP
ncbi:MAG: ATP-binding protein [Bacteroidales bacterium]|nr:ATP-binding protein [Bacteroidales bacterium]